MVKVDRRTKKFALHPMDTDFIRVELAEEGIFGSRSLNRRAADWYARQTKPRSEWNNVDDVLPNRHEFDHRIRAGDFDAAATVLDEFAEFLLWRATVTPLIAMHDQLAGRLTDSQVQLSYLTSYGMTRLIAGPVPEAITLLIKAVRLAEELNDRQHLQRSLYALGDAYRMTRQLDAAITVGRSLVRGLDILRQAQSLAPAISLASALPEHHMMAPLVQDRLTGHLGLAHFDSGDFGRAEPLLRSSYESALTAGLPSTAQTMANYFAQLLMTCGRFEEAEELLHSALAMAYTSKTSYHKGYNLALLGKLYLEWDRPAAAEKPMLAGWRQTILAGNLSIIPLVRNYLGELYLYARYRGRDIRRAAALFHETVAECQRTGFQRSEIAALALGAQTALQAQDIDRAMACSAAAVRRLDEVGTMPALRTEEIYLTRYQVLMAVNRDAEAQPWIDKARATLEAKAATIPDRDLRRIFCTRVQTSRAILTIT